MRLLAAACAAVRPLTSGPTRPAHWLGASARAVYLGVPAPSGATLAVIAILARDAVRLPCGLRLATTGAELPLTALAPLPAAPGQPVAGVPRARLPRPAGLVTVGPAAGWAQAHMPAAPAIGDGQVSWPGPDGPVVVRVVREWAPRRVVPGRVSAPALTAARAALPGRVPGIGGPLLDGLRQAAGSPATGSPAAGRVAVAGLLGRGGGLTPCGDDVLAGFLAGASAFRLPVAGLRRAVGERAAATTALSAQLLRHAADGECIDEVADLAAALAGRGDPAAAARRLLAVGHSSGTGLAHGLMLAAECALRSGPAAAGEAAGTAAVSGVPGGVR